MDGERFLAHVDRSALPHLTGDEPLDVNGLNAWGNQWLLAVLDNGYGYDTSAGLSIAIEGAAQFAQKYLDGFNIVASVDRQVRNARNAGDRAEVRRLAPEESLPAPDQLLETVLRGVKRVHLMGIAFSNGILSRSIARLDQQSERIVGGKTTIPKELKQILTNQRGQLARYAANDGYAVRATRTMKHGRLVNDDEGLARDLVLDTSVEGWSRKFFPPEWLNDHHDWDEPFHFLCSRLSEMDAYVALYEWCIDRGLPMLPIIPPTVIDEAMHPYVDGKLNSDVLLCSLASNEVVPIQVKNTINQQTLDRYSDEVVLLSRVELGTVATEHVPVTDTDKSYTAHRSHTEHGALLVEFMRAYGNGGAKRSGKRPATPKINATFEMLDRKVLPKLAVR